MMSWCRVAADPNQFFEFFEILSSEFQTNKMQIIINVCATLTLSQKESNRSQMGGSFENGS